MEENTGMLANILKTFDSNLVCFEFAPYSNMTTNIDFFFMRIENLIDNIIIHQSQGKKFKKPIKQRNHAIIDS